MEAFHLDIIILIVLGISAAIGFLRGFTHEVFTVLGWVCAVFAVIWLTPAVKPIARDLIETKIIADVVAAAVIFLLTLAGFGVASHFAGNNVRESALSAVDRSLGFAFGLLRGLVLVSLVYIALTSFQSEDSQPPEWFAAAKTKPLVTSSARMLQTVLPNTPRFGKKDEDTADNRVVDTKEVTGADLIKDAIGSYMSGESDAAADAPKEPAALPEADRAALKRILDDVQRKTNGYEPLAAPNAQEQDALDQLYQQYAQ